MPNESGSFSRTDALLALRVGATIAVVFGHAASFFGGLSFTQPPQQPHIQTSAVVVFFAVSGWTIAWVLDTRDSYSLGRFTFDRFGRLAIPLIPVVIGYGLIEWWVWGESHPDKESLSITQALGNILMLQDLTLRIPGIRQVETGITSFGINQPLWTLSLEFWTYIAFGGVVLTVKRQGLVKPVTALAGIAIAMFAVLMLGDAVFISGGNGLPLIWLLGAMLYYAQRNVPDLSNWARLAVLPFWVLAASFLVDNDLATPAGRHTAALNLAIFANFALFMLVVPGLRIHRYVVRIIGFLGAFAYTAYLVHYPLMAMTRTHLGTGTVIAVLLGLASFALAWVVSLPFEQRYKAIRDRVWSVGEKLFRRTSSTAPAPAKAS